MSAINDVMAYAVFRAETRWRFRQYFYVTPRFSFADERKQLIDFIRR